MIYYFLKKKKKNYDLLLLFFKKNSHFLSSYIQILPTKQSLRDLFASNFKS